MQTQLDQINTLQTQIQALNTLLLRSQTMVLQLWAKENPEK